MTPRADVESTPRVVLGDSVEIMAGMLAGSVSVVVVDPPYGLEFMGKEWDKLDGSDAAMQAFHAAWLHPVHTALAPGAPVFSFSGTRTYHRLAAAMHEAGFGEIELRAWLYGNGFNKGPGIGNLLDAELGVKPHVVGPNPRAKQQTGQSDTAAFGDKSANLDLREPSSPEGQAWKGWRTTIRPCWEPILCGRKGASHPGTAAPSLRVVNVLRKPLSERNLAQNVLRWGAGGLNIDGTRVDAGTDTLQPAGQVPAKANNVGAAPDAGRGIARVPYTLKAAPPGRVPANVVMLHRAGCRPSGLRVIKSTGHHPAARGAGSAVAGATGHVGQAGLVERQGANGDGTETVLEWDCAPDCPVAQLDAQAGNTASRFWFNAASDADLYAYLRALIAPSHLLDCAVPQHPVTAAEVASAPDNHFHGLIVLSAPDLDPAPLLRVLRPGGHLLLIAPETRPTNWRAVCAAEDRGFEVRDAVLVLAGAGAHYCAKAPRSQRWGLRHCACGWQEARPAAVLREEPTTIPCPACPGEAARLEHPTVKPLGVMEWLCKETGVGAGGLLLDPFAGTGTTLLAARRLGVAAIGIERDPQYVAIARARLGAGTP